MGFLYIIATLFAWISLYQGLLALGSAPPKDTELVSLSGIVRHVDTPLMRNRLVDQVVLEIEVPPVRMVRMPVPQSALPLDVARTLPGQTVTVVYAGQRLRNRWAYDIRTPTQHLARLEDGRARDAAARSSAVQLMLVNGLIGGGLFLTAWYLRRRRRSVA